MLRTLDLFSGIGGFSLALKPITKTVGYCDIEASCREVIASRIRDGQLENAPIFKDVCEIDKKTLRHLRPDIITAGFPCTDISIANVQGQGLLGPRSKLFFEIIRIIDAASPNIKAVFLENSHAIVKRGLDEVTHEFTKRGFKLAWCITNASDVGAPHRRKRWYAVAYKERYISMLTPIRDQIEYNWKKEPVKRMIRKPLLKEQKDELIQRCRMLGNSIVPQCAAHAWNTLVSSIKVSRTQGHVKTQRLTLERNLKLVITDGHETFTRKLWATPCHCIWHIYSRITSSRAKTVLTVQLFYEQKTRVNGIKTEEYKRWMVNPNFIEYMMGYPLDWTRGAAPLTISNVCLPQGATTHHH